MKKLFLLLMLGVGLLSTSCEKEPFLEYELPNCGNTLEFTADGGSIYVDITAECSYEILCKDNWVSYTETYSGIAVTAQANLETNIRESEIRILYYHRKDQIYKSIKVKQAAFEPKLEIDKTELNYDVNGGSKTIYVTTNAEFNFSESLDWISCSKSSNRATIEVSASDVTEERSAEVKISLTKYDLSETIKVTQKAFEPEFEVKTTELDFEAEGGAKTISVSANFDYSVYGSANWLTYKKSSSGICVTASVNTKEYIRTTEITISREKYGLLKKITVSQAGLSKDSVMFYTSSDGNIITPYKTDVFGANIVSNTYSNGQGIIIFDAPVTSIGYRAFYNCSSLTSATIGDSVTSIGEYAFADCSSLTSVTIPDSVTSIGDCAFECCKSLTSVTIPDRITSIGQYTFLGCKSLTSVTIPDSVTSIGNSAFRSCKSLTSVTIPDSVTSIRSCAFSYCGSLTAFYGKFSSTDNRCLVVDGVLNSFAPAGLTEYVIPGSVTSIEEYAFADCSSLTSITIPDSVTSIGYRAFIDCSSLTSVTIPSSVTKLGSNAFCGCTGELTVNCNSLLYINNADDSPFYCSKFNKVTFGNDVTGIGKYAFYKSENLHSVTIPNSVEFISYGAFALCSELNTIKCKCRTPPAMGDKVFYGEHIYGLKIFIPRYTKYSYERADGWRELYLVETDFE